MWHPDTPFEYRNAITIGDAWTLAEALPPDSIDAYFLDPIYQKTEDYARAAR
ncbi:MAG TPA: hypothetical protein VEL76_09720 [Gemmataceae bacterium]|nr:hypothetical protein [Gemmataceae bacterium]